ncbi:MULTISPECIES: hypothetical protein [unclassified Pseudomonas]|uniref:hypothetical protein n=1 Tax=unclassified Pseudomonas TaxID=196821 RepID=UPI001179BE29|nr:MULTISPECIES: hypothetical protein [unclassified Pseudomonas]
MINRAFNPHRGANQVTTPAAASASISIDPVAKSVRLVNSGANICHVRVGTGAQTATTADLPVFPLSSVIITKGDGEDTLAHISAAGTTLHVQTGEGGI